MEPILISAVSPVYKGEGTVEELTQRLRESLSKITQRYEILLIDDGSPDNQWSKMVELAREYPEVKVLKLSRNFGQHYAITAGLAQAQGEWVTVLDCDLQDQPEEIPRLLEVATSQNFDQVLARRAVRKDSLYRRLASKAFYGVFSFLTDTEQDSTVANFGVYNRKVVQAILQLGDSVRYFPTMTQWVGFSRTYVDVEHSARNDGASTYSLGRLLTLAGNNIVAYSNKPLRLTILLGLMISSVAFMVALYYLGLFLQGEIVVLGYTSLILSIWFLGGVNIAVLGIVGVYVGYTFERVKDRPTFIISESVNLRNE